jgi:predicted metal-dependent hydrolase
MNKIKLGNEVLNYEIIRTNRKTMGISIDNNKNLIVRSPKNIAEDKIKDVLNKKTKWILSKLKEMNQIKSVPKEKEFMTGEKLPYLGRRYRLVVSSRSISKVEVKLYHGKFIINYPDELKNNDKCRREKIQDALINWYREHAKEKIIERVDKYKVKLDVEPNNVVVKKQKKRWGSCSNKGNLNFNWKIIMAPMSIVDYIVVHELTHLIHDNHSREFWQMIKAIIPDYKKRSEWLRINGPRLTL